MTIELKRLFGTDLCRIVVYGSYARGDYTENSDIDVMILVKAPDEGVVVGRIHGSPAARRQNNFLTF